MFSPLLDVLTARSRAIQLESANEYRAYRSQSSKRLANVRKSLGIQSKSKAKKLKSLEKEDVTTVDHVRALVLSADRSWAKAMEDKAALDTNRGTAGALRRHMISRLRRAYDSVSVVVEALDSNSASLEIEDVAKLELYAYAALIEGAYRFERHHWPAAVSAYSVARVCLSVLPYELGRDVISATVDPALAYAVAKSNQVRQVDLPTLTVQQVQTQAAHAPVRKLIESVDETALAVGADNQNPIERVGTIRWRSHSAKLQSPDLASAVLNAWDKESHLKTAAGPGAFDDTLLAWQEAVDLAHEYVEKLDESVHSDEAQQMHIVSTYLSYHLLLRRIERDLRLVQQLQAKVPGTTKKRLELARDVVRIYDTILQSGNELKNLAGVGSDDELRQTLDSVSGYFDALRTATVAEAYVISAKYPEAVALYQLASTQQPNAAATIVEDVPEYVATVAQFASLRQSLANNVTRVTGLASLHQPKSTTANRAVVDSLDVLPEGKPEQVLTSLVDFSSVADKFRPVPVKPAFFDIAFNFIEYSPQDQVETETVAGSDGDAEKSSQPKGKDGKSFFGLFGR